MINYRNYQIKPLQKDLNNLKQQIESLTLWIGQNKEKLETAGDDADKSFLYRKISIKENLEKEFKNLKNIENLVLKDFYNTCNYSGVGYVTKPHPVDDLKTYDELLYMNMQIGVKK